MGRLFAFGCSFTNYRWWTWADILGAQYQHYQNWGQAGGGNPYIFNSVMEADQRCKFNSDDTVLICWTNVMREDRYVQDRGWITLGNVMTATNVYTKEFLADAVCERGNFIRDLAMIKAVRELLQARGVRWRFLSMCPMTQMDPWDDKKSMFGDVCDLYSDVLAAILPSFIDVLGHNYWEKDQHLRWRYDGGGVDYHPTTQEHLRYLDHVLPGWVQNDSLRDQLATKSLIMDKRANGSCKQPRL